MNYLVLLVTIMSLHAHHDCAALDPMTNTAAWTRKGNAYTTTYRDNGDSLKWRGKPPRYVRHLATHNSGTAVRLRCLT